MIIQNNEQALRVKCENVLPNEINNLISTLEHELLHANKLGANGIGLAAPQIGINKNIAIIRIGTKYSINLVNCNVSAKFDPLIFQEEGCLSFPGRVENTSRFQEVHISNNLIEPFNFIATGLLAVVCQHEIEHWNGQLFFDSKIKEIIKKNGPNEPCFCGSLKKFKKCCGK